MKIAIIEEKTLLAIQTENYKYIEELLQSGAISPRMTINGKPLIIHAAIHDKAEMILLLASYGAMIVEPICDEGKDIMEHAMENKAIHANAQIIVIKLNLAEYKKITQLLWSTSWTFTPKNF